MFLVPYHALNLIKNWQTYQLVVYFLHNLRESTHSQNVYFMYNVSIC
jgi:hypothetical protein